MRCEVSRGGNSKAIKWIQAAVQSVTDSLWEASSLSLEICDNWVASCGTYDSTRQSPVISKPLIFTRR
jgi:hypothetical protein